MSYVMVPVPADHVQQVMEHVVRLMHESSTTPWDAETVAELFESIDEPSRALLSTVAQGVLEGASPTEPDVVATIELDWREVLGVMRELNEIARGESHPPLVLRRTTVETLPNGRTREVRVLDMSKDVAQLVNTADRAHLLGGEDPLRLADT